MLHAHNNCNGLKKREELLYFKEFEFERESDAFARAKRVWRELYGGVTLC